MKKFFSKKRVILSLGTIAVVAILAFASTNAFFSDTEVSEGNSFTSGAIDLKIDSQCTYNSAQSAECGNWEMKDLNPTSDKFFNFSDVKPGDQGESTISLHMDSNDALGCLIIDRMTNDDLGLTEPELLVDETDGLGNGELAQEINFFAWDDDGDNIWEQGENPLFSNIYGPASDVLNGKGYNLGILPTTEDTYLGIYWCYGDINVDSENYKLSCDGSAVTNASQTDQLTADVWFYVEQARNNENFVCPTPVQTKNTVLENKTEQWDIIANDDTFGNITFSNNDTSFNGTVNGTGLVPNAKYQISLNGPGGCTFTDHGLAGLGLNAFQSGYWNNGVNLEPVCGTPGEGVYNTDLINDHYTFIADSNGAFTHDFDMNLPAGNYTGVKVLVKKMLDTHVSPWSDTGVGYPTFNLYETSAINFTIL